MDIERPNDPVSFIAYYLLKHKDEIQLPQPPEKEDEGEKEEGEGEVQEEEGGDD